MPKKDKKEKSVDQEEVKKAKKEAFFELLLLACMGITEVDM